jgi:hypothetical protein
LDSKPAKGARPPTYTSSNIPGTKIDLSLRICLKI